MTYDPEGQTFDHGRALALDAEFKALGISQGYSVSEAGTFPTILVEGRLFAMGDVDDTGVLGLNTYDDDDETGPFLSAWTPFTSRFDPQYAGAIAAGVVDIARRLVTNPKQKTKGEIS